MEALHCLFDLWKLAFFSFYQQEKLVVLLAFSVPDINGIYFRYLNTGCKSVCDEVLGNSGCLLLGCDCNCYHAVLVIRHTHSSSLVSYWVVIWVNYIIVIIWSFPGVIWRTAVDQRYLRITDFSVIPIRAIRSVVSNSKRITMSAVLTLS